MVRQACVRHSGEVAASEVCGSSQWSIAGGAEGIVKGWHNTVLGGFQNSALGVSDVSVGGAQNIAHGQSSAVLGGHTNRAAMDLLGCVASSMAKFLHCIFSF